MAVKKYGSIIGHLPRQISPVSSFIHSKRWYDLLSSVGMQHVVTLASSASLLVLALVLWLGLGICTLIQLYSGLQIWVGSPVVIIKLANFKAGQPGLKRAGFTIRP